MAWGEVGTAITGTERVAVATLAFRVGGELRVAAVVKATFALAPDGAMVLVEPDPIVRADEHRDEGASSSLKASSDLVPYRPRADLLVRGHARAPMDQPTPAMAVRLMVARGQEVVLDKRLAVRGAPDPSSPTRAPLPFAAMQLAWELAARTPDNPAGVVEGPRAWPYIVDPRNRDRPAGLGPVSPRWAPRRRLVEGRERALDGRVPALTGDFPWAYFNAAPEDQRLDFLRGDEWIGFEGMSAQRARVQSCLPSVNAAARVYGPVAGPGRPIPLQADTLALDADRLRCSVVWRGSFPVTNEEALATLHVFADVAVGGQATSLPASHAVSAIPPPPPSVPEAAKPRISPLPEAQGSHTLELPAYAPAAGKPATPFTPAPARDRTMEIDTALLLRMPTPFAPIGAPPPRAPPPGPLPAATPFEQGPLPAPPSPPPPAAATTTPHTLTVPVHVAEPPPPPPAPFLAVESAPADDAGALPDAPQSLGAFFLAAMERAGWAPPPP